MKIALIGDLHYPSKNGVTKPMEQKILQARDEFFPYFLNQFFSEQADFHIALGDLTNFGKADEYKEVYQFIRQYDSNFVHVIGNHDLYQMGYDAVHDFTKQKPYDFMEKDGVVYVRLATARELSPDNYGGSLDDEQLLWLDQIIHQSGTKPVIIFAHHPLVDTTKFSNREMYSIDPAINMWSILSQKKGNGFYLNGHTHVNDIIKKEQWNFCQCCAVMDFPSIRILTIEAGRISFSTKEIVLSERMKENLLILKNGVEAFVSEPNASAITSIRELTVYF